MPAPLPAAPREKHYRDPIHNIITLDLSTEEDRVLSALIDTCEFQRLRRIRQLGMAHMAFQGAEHSRFTHSIGVMHLARRLLERLRRHHFVEPRKALAVQCAALLHDLGHGPFSHVIEKFFTRHHEEWTRLAILDPDTEVHRVLASYDREFPADVAAALTNELKPRWLCSLISSQLDADRFDYLLRDSHMTGARYGVFDLERLMLMLRVHEDQERVVVAAKGLLPLEKYLQSRYQMYRQVYFHKTVTSAEAMLMAALRRASDLAREGRLEELPGRSPFRRVLAGQSDLAVADYLALDDSVVLGALNDWSRGADPVLRDLSNRLLNRRLFKAVEIADPENDMFMAGRMEHAREIISRTGLDPRFYLLLSKSADTPYKPYAGRGAKSAIWIEDERDPSVLREVQDVSPTIAAFTQRYDIHRAFFPATAGDAELRSLLFATLSEAPAAPPDAR
ncbi:MAG: HD domain-containing protein [Candidatus Sumerlaeia bacterium]|nr:HD domain-containing protein [Candidatus Sumerlaeia bacterium]